MEFIRLGNTEIMVSRIMMGTWQAGKEMWSNIDDKESIRAIRTAFEAGINTFDTAEQYGKGHSERILGSALAGYRDRIVYATKVSPQNLGGSRIVNACHNSLKNLKTDYIDLYQIHWPAGSWGSKPVPVEETFAALNRLKEQGKILAIGVSNYSIKELNEAMIFGNIASIQPPYSLFWRYIEKEIMPFCMDHNISVLAYAPMAQGILTGKFKAGHRFSKGDHRSRNKLFKKENMVMVQSSLKQLAMIAERKGITLGQLALAWVTSHPGTCAIAGARSPEQVLQNADATEISLSDDDLAEMDLISRTVTDPMDDRDPVIWG